MQGSHRTPSLPPLSRRQLGGLGLGAAVLSALWPRPADAQVTQVTRTNLQTRPIPGAGQPDPGEHEAVIAEVQDAGPAVSLPGARLLYAMLRVVDLERSLAFYVGALGMRLLRRRDYPEGEFTLAFVGYDGEDDTTIELTHNWDGRTYEHGTAFGHVAIGVRDVHAACAALADAGATVLRPAGPMRADPSEVIAFVADPDGYRIELVQVEK